MRVEFYQMFSFLKTIFIFNFCRYVVGVYRSEEHTSELQSLRHLVCRLLLVKKKRFSQLRPATQGAVLPGSLFAITTLQPQRVAPLSSFRLCSMAPKTEPGRRACPRPDPPAN